MNKKAMAVCAVSALFFLVIKLLWANRLGLTEDEAYYWTWSQQPDAGYFDHPPVIAWLIGAGSSLSERSELAVRWLPITLSILALMSLCRQHKPDLGIWTLAAMPLMAMGGIFATPDTPLIAAWCMGIWAAIEHRWRWFGVAVGIAMMSKYTGALLLLSVLLAEPKAFKKRQCWEAIAIAGLITLPNIWWNYQHDWISYRFQLNHIGQASGSGGHLNFFLSQLLLAGPLTLLVGGIWVCKKHSDRQSKIVATSIALPWLTGLFVGGEANWAAPAYASLAFAFAGMTGKWARAAWAAVSLNIVISSLFLAHSWAPLVDIKKDPVHRTMGGDVISGAVMGWEGMPIMTERYQEASWIQFYGDVQASVFPGQGRPTQYDIWGVKLPTRGILVRPKTSHAPPYLQEKGFKITDIHVVFHDEESLTGRAQTPHVWDVIHFQREMP